MAELSKNSNQKAADLLREIADQIENGELGEMASVKTFTHSVDVPVFPGIISGAGGPIRKERCGATVIVSTVADPLPLLAREWFTKYSPAGGPQVEFIFGSRAP